MTVLCPRCGESSSNSEWHCKKCGFSIKNYLDNQKRFNNGVNNKNSVNGQASVCLKEEEEVTNKEDDVQENIMRLISSIKIVSGQEKCEKNKAIATLEHKVKEEILQDSLSVVSKNSDETMLKDNELKEETKAKTNAKDKSEPVTIIAKKVAEDVIILPPNRVKVEIEAAKEVVEKEETEDEGITLSDEIVEDKIKKIKEKLVHKEGTEKEAQVFESKDTEAREALIEERAIPCTDGYSFREFLAETKEYNDGTKVILIMSGVILVLVFLIILLTSTATAAVL